ncbi:NosD domain-containing protein [Methanosarcina sp. T3]|uniref:NosD domain-containing protein n=1 Tax=Methanosarcina sp. T3 TaxID=3439062 RepID=UPI003F82A054
MDAGGSGNYTTIQAAVNNATSGDTIIVYPGTYTEVIDVDVANLTIHSLSGNPENTIVRTLSPSHNFKVIANNVTISGFKIIGEGYYTGVFMTGVSGVNITNNEFSGNDCAIQVQSSGGCNLINNTVSGSTSYGFHLSSSSNCILASNTISNTSYEGINMSNSGSCVLANNIVSDTDDDGIYLYSSSNCALTGNTVSETHDGIDLNSSGNCNLTGNTISNIDNDGICLYDSKNCILTGNTVSNFDGYGIYLEASDESVLGNNTASSGIYGISLYDVRNCTLTGNIMSGNRYNFGYETYEISDLDKVSGNIIDTRNLVDGKAVYFLEREPDPSIGSDAGAIYCINCGDVEIKDLVLQNNIYAVFLYNTSSEMQNNTINDSIYGVAVLNSQDVRLAGSRIEDSMAPVILQKVMNATIADNTVQSSFFGIQAVSSENCTFSNNSIQDSTFVGIATLSSGNCMLLNNSVQTSRYGIITLGSENCTLTGNSIQESTENYGVLFSENSKLTGNEESILKNTLISESPFKNSNLVQSEAPDSFGIYSISSQGLRLENNVIEQISDIGIYLGGCQDAELVRNSVLDIECVGIYTEGSSNVELLDNTVQNVTGTYLLPAAGTQSLVSKSLRLSGCGIYFNTSQDVRFVNNSVLNIGDVGIYSHNSSDVDILNNTVQNVTGTSLMFFSGLSKSSLTSSNGVGILSEYTQGLRVENNTIDQIDNTGILLDGCQDIEFVSNSVRNTGYVGIYLGDSSGVDLLDNEVRNVTYRPLLYDSGLKESTLTSSNLVQRSRPSGVGVLSEYSQDLRFENNIIGQIDYTGILLGGCQDAELVRNSVRDAGYMGIYTASSSGVELLENTVQNVTGEYELYRSGNLPFVSSPLVGDNPGISGYGIGLDYSEDFKLEGNTVKDSSQVWGIYLYEPVNATLESNYIESCKIGLASYDGYNCSISDCSATNCSSGGILIENFQESMGAEYTVTGCTVDGSDIGLLVTGESILADNTLSGNSYGIVLYDVNNSLIYGNTMVENSLAGLTLDLDRTEILSRIGLVGSMESPESGNNTIYNNYFSNVNNTLIYSEANNTWNTSKTSGESIVGGPYLGGNYWANPSGTGFSENCTDADRDGIADSSYEIVNGTFDYLPLTEIPSTTTTKHKSSANYIPSGGSSTGVTGIDSAQKRVAAGSRATFTFNNPASGIMGLSFTSQQYSGNVIVRIEALDSGSSGNVPGGEVYRLMNILVGNERFESGDNINGASLNFRVSKSWVEENNIDVSSITINRFHDEEWNPLVTEMAYEDEEYYYFTAETPGFSKYAITGDKLGDVVIAPAEEEETGTVTGEEQTGDVEKSAPGFESTFAVLGILASVFFAKRRILK